MFYDDAFQRITEGSAFSEEATLVIGSAEYAIKGFFCSGSYGQKEFDKGYTTAKTVNRQSFKISKLSLPNGVSQRDIIRQTLTVREKSFVVREVTGNDSGILNLDLVPKGQS